MYFIGNKIFILRLFFTISFLVVASLIGYVIYINNQYYEFQFESYKLKIPNNVKAEYKDYRNLNLSGSVLSTLTFIDQGVTLYLSNSNKPAQYFSEVGKDNFDKELKTVCMQNIYISSQLSSNEYDISFVEQDNIGEGTSTDWKTIFPELSPTRIPPVELHPIPYRAYVFGNYFTKHFEFFDYDYVTLSMTIDKDIYENNFDKVEDFISEIMCSLENAEKI
jgi:hypothetical protein